MKAMILAAGLGSRFLPLTNELPKPLLPLFNKPLIYYTLDWLQAHEITQVVINLHHLGDLIAQAVGDGKRWDMEIKYSWEEELLGTGGGVKRVADFLGEESFLLVNSDVLINADLAPALAFHRQKGAIATMLLAQDDTKRYGAVGVDNGGRICQLPWYTGSCEVSRQGVFSGVHILEPEVLDYLPQGVSCINRDGYKAMLAANEEVYACFWSQETVYACLWPPLNAKLWYDLGEPDTYLATHWQMLDSNLPSEFFQLQEGVWYTRPEKIPLGVEFVPPVLIGCDCKLAPGSRIGPYAVLGDGAQVQKGGIVQRSILLSDAQVTANQKVTSSILGKQVILTVEF